MKVTSLIIIVSFLSSFYCNAESAPNKDNRVVNLDNDKEETYTLYPDLDEERPNRCHLQDKSMSMQAAVNANPPKKKAAPKKKTAPKSSKSKSSKSTSCTSSKSSKSSSSRSGRSGSSSSRSSRCSKSSKSSSKSSKSSSDSRDGRRIERHQLMMAVSTAVLIVIPMNMIRKTALFNCDECLVLWGIDVL